MRNDDVKKHSEIDSYNHFLVSVRFLEVLVSELEPEAVKASMYLKAARWTQ